MAVFDALRAIILSEDVPLFRLANRNFRIQLLSPRIKLEKILFRLCISEKKQGVVLLDEKTAASKAALCSFYMAMRL